LTILLNSTFKKNNGVTLTCLKNIKKIIILATISTTLTFSNNAVADIFDDLVSFIEDKARCKVEYTQLNLINGIETETKEYVDFHSESSDLCSESSEELIEEFKNWLAIGPTNIIVKLDKTIECKEEEIDYKLNRNWSNYKACEKAYTQKIIDAIFFKYPRQVGYGIYDSEMLSLFDK
jgi:hypothetical protein